MVGTTTMYGVRVLGVIKNINIKLRSSHKTYNWSGRKLKNSDFEEWELEQIMIAQCWEALIFLNGMNHIKLWICSVVNCRP